jgi:hypothetical protein
MGHGLAVGIRRLVPPHDAVSSEISALPAECLNFTTGLPRHNLDRASIRTPELHDLSWESRRATDYGAANRRAV